MAEDTPDKEPHKEPKLVVGVDGSPGSIAAVRWSFAEAARHEAALHVVCAWDPDHHSVGNPHVPHDERAPDSHEVAQLRAGKVLKAATMASDQPPRIVLSTPRGPIGPVLVDEAQDADLLVLGTTYLARKGRAGEVTEYCVVNSPVPVVFVPAPPPVA